MSTIEELLVNYKTINDQLAKNQELNEKIFKELTFTKIKKSFSFLNMMDYFNSVFIPASAILFGYCIYKCSDNTLMLILSIIMTISVFLSYYLFYKPLRFRFFISELLIESSVSNSIARIQEYMYGLRKARLWSLPTMLPYFVLALPISWYVIYHWEIMGVYSWNLEHGTLNQLLFRVGFGLIIGTFLVWEMFDWLYLPVLKKAVKNLEELNAI